MADFEFDANAIEARLTPLLSELLAKARLQVTFRVVHTAGQYARPYESPDLVISFEGRDADLLLENKGEVLKALEHVALEALRFPQEQRERVLFDCQDYRMTRVGELELAAQAAAERVRRTGIAYKFNPMSSRERRIVHMAVRGEAGVRTQSEGVGPQRQVVIHPAQPASHTAQSKGHHPSR